MDIQIAKASGREASRESAPPNFPPYRHGGFTLEMENLDSGNVEPAFSPLRPQSESGRAIPIWELTCRTRSGSLAGGCAVAMPPGRGDFPSPAQAPHPVIGEWLSALRYTGLRWLECGSFAIAPGFPEEGVAELLWEGVTRLLRRNGVSFLVGCAPEHSQALDMAKRRGARTVEPEPGSTLRFFLYVDP